jgi:hypothetical protein
MGLLSRFKKTQEPPSRPGINLCLLQSKLERYTTERLNGAMQAAWHRQHEPERFFGMNLDNEHGLVKFNDFYIPIYFYDRRLNSAELGNLELPTWAKHNAFCQISFVPGGEGLPTPNDRHEFTGFIALLAIELATQATVGYLFKEDRALVPRNLLTKQIVLETKLLDPNRLPPLPSTLPAVP